MIHLGSVGKAISKGGETFRVLVNGPVEIQATIADNNDGTYTVKYTPKAAGSHRIAVLYEVIILFAVRVHLFRINYLGLVLIVLLLKNLRIQLELILCRCKNKMMHYLDAAHSVPNQLNYKKGMSNLRT